jgi:predicted nuclease of predicted toxin-antitoxin system
MPLPPELADWLVGQGHDAVHALALGMDRATDQAIIDRAHQDGRTIVTADLDYPRLLALSQASRPSLILFRGGDWRDVEVIERMAGVLHSVTQADIESCILVVDRDRVRRRRLPIG